MALGKKMMRKAADARRLLTVTKSRTNDTSLVNIFSGNDCNDVSEHFCITAMWARIMAAARRKKAIDVNCAAISQRPIAWLVDRGEDRWVHFIENVKETAFSVVFVFFFRQSLRTYQCVMLFHSKANHESVNATNSSYRNGVLFQGNNCFRSSNCLRMKLF